MTPERARDFTGFKNVLKRPVLRAIVAQALAVAALLLYVQGSVALGFPLLSLWPKIALVSSIAVGLTIAFRLPKWWIIIQAALPPLVYLGIASGLPGWSFGLAFAALFLVFSNVAGERVPLYLSNATVWHALARFCEPDKPVRFIDLGCGLGGTLFALAKANKHPDSTFWGVETAPFPFAVCRLRAFLTGDPRIQIELKSIWDVDLKDHSLIYAFLSPAPMPDLLDKAQREMREEAVLISNSFEDPERPAPEQNHLEDRRKTVLHIWRGPPSKGSAK